MVLTLAEAIDQASNKAKGIQTGYTGAPNYTPENIQAMTQQYADLLKPQYDRSSAQLSNTLAGRGVFSGTPALNNFSLLENNRLNQIGQYGSGLLQNAISTNNENYWKGKTLDQSNLSNALNAIAPLATGPNATQTARDTYNSLISQLTGGTQLPLTPAQRDTVTPPGASPGTPSFLPPAQAAQSNTIPLQQAEAKFKSLQTKLTELKNAMNDAGRVQGDPFKAVRLDFDQKMQRVKDLENAINTGGAPQTYYDELYSLINWFENFSNNPQSFVTSTPPPQSTLYTTPGSPVGPGGR